MKIPCQVRNTPAYIVGYTTGRKNKALAVVIMLGKLHAVKLRDIDLGELPEQLGVAAKTAKVVQIDALKATGAKVKK